LNVPRKREGNDTRECKHRHEDTDARRHKKCRRHSRHVFYRLAGHSQDDTGDSEQQRHALRPRKSRVAIAETRHNVERHAHGEQACEAKQLGDAMALGMCEPPESGLEAKRTAQ
jgi:hypothetical protein